MGITTLVYTYVGGMRAVVWTDVIQFFLYLAGALVALALLVGKITGGWDGLVQAGEAAGKFRLFNFATDPSNPYTLWAGLIGGLFLSTATHGADQLMVQRYLSSRSQRGAAMALVASGFVVFAQFALFLLIGVGLYVFFQGTSRANIEADRAFASFIIHDMPKGVGLIGVLVASVFAAAMSTTSGSLNASATTSLNDLIQPLLPRVGEHTMLRLSKLLTGLWGGAQMGVALGAVTLKGTTVVEAVLSIASFTTGIVLGLFLLGQLARGVAQSAALIGLWTGLLVVSYVAFGANLGPPLYPWSITIAWPWYALIGSCTVFCVGLLADRVGQRLASTGARRASGVDKL